MKTPIQLLRELLDSGASFYPSAIEGGTKVELDFDKWEKEARELLATPAPFVVKHYEGDEGPTIKGNGFDGLRIGNEREDAEEFVKWVNERLGLR